MLTPATTEGKKTKFNSVATNYAAEWATNANFILFRIGPRKNILSLIHTHNRESVNPLILLQCLSGKKEKKT